MRYLIVLFTFTLASCGYHTGPTGQLSPYQTISIPYVRNDETGLMTAALVKTVSAESGLQYVKSGGDLTLLVEIMEYENENIGYRYERKNDGRLRHSVIPVETRLYAVAQVALMDNATGNKLAGPVNISAYADFDHEYEKTRNGVNVFSLGQLTDYDDAYDAAFQPLYMRLSNKIADFIMNF
jgi:hypothetical protein